MLKINKRLPKTSEFMWILGIVFMSLGVCICKKTGLGVSMIAAPTFILQEYLSSLSSFFSVGVTEYLLQGVILILLCLIVRKFDWRFLLCFAAAIIYGYCLDFWLFILGADIFSTVALRWIMLLVGDACVSLGVACFFRTYFPLQIHELFVAEVSTKFSSSVTRTKWIYDICCLVVSVILAFSLFGDVASFDWKRIYAIGFHSIGLATLVTTIINAPLIKLCGIILDKIFLPSPLFPKLANILSRQPKTSQDK